MIVGAAAVQVGTAIFEDPAAPLRILADLVRWADAAGIRHLADLGALA
jgi:dihydroorotate dehydrogenase (NAD+) catalytic subunit